MQLSRPWAFYLQASIILFFLAGSSAPTPLYVVYQAAWGFSPTTVTVVFGIYALAVLAALLVLGSLSDYVGRRPVLLAATLLQAGAMLLFVNAHSVGGLVLARLLQGIATGAAAGAVGAGLLDIDRARGTVANAVGPMLGTATGGIASGLLVQYLPTPTMLVYLLLFGIFLLQAVGVLLMPESAARKPGAWRSLRPHLALPERLREPFWLAVPALVGTWSLVGFYGSLGPSLLRRLAHSQSLVLGGLALFVLATSGALTVLLTHQRPAPSVMMLGSALLFGGVGLTLSAISRGSLPLFWLGAVTAGAGFGAGFQGAIRSVAPLAAATERAGVLSLLYVVAYSSMGAPAVLGGLRVVHGGGLLGTSLEYGSVVMLLAALAFLGQLRRLRAPSAARVTP